MIRLALAYSLLLGPPPPQTVEIQRPGDAVTWAFRWRAPEGCPTRAQVLERIDEYLPQLELPPERATSVALRIDVELTRDGDTWVANLQLSGRDGEQNRRFSTPDCSELADASALIAALALDPVLTARGLTVLSAALTEPGPDEPLEPLEPEDPKAPDDPGAPPPNPETTEPPSEGSDPVTTEPTRDTKLHLSEAGARPADPRDPAEVGLHRPRVGLRIQGGGSYGPTTTGYAAVGGGLAVFEGPWRWQLDAGWWTPRRIELSDGRAGRVQSWWLGTRGCFVPMAGRVELPLCPGVEFGQIIARGVSPTTNARSARYLWAAAVVSQGLAWAFSEHFALTAEAGLLVALTRGSFSIDGQRLQAVSPVGVRGLVGLELRL